ncbi:MAG TPA: prephenate dehydratase [Micropepsaceae bacterium]|jgi:prephenate dehydratase|nr:prephenate dehydratase [Micropepsaceae bacterium]
MSEISLIRNARKVVFQGEPGSFSHAAAREALPHCEAVAAPTFDEAFAALREGAVDLGLIPVENSLHGRITDIHHLLPDAPLYILGEHFHRVRLQLMAAPGASLSTITTVVSQEPALGQCRNIVREMGLKRQLWADTAGAARHVADMKDKTLAAVASKLAAEIHHLNILKSDVEDADHNVTRFLIMAREPEDADNNGQPVITSFIFRVRNVPAALYKALGGFATNSVNLTKLESYQLEGSFNATQFFADIDGHPEEPNVQLAFEELRFFTSSLKILGAYPAHPFRRTLKN